MLRIPRSPGVYVLVIRVKSSAEVIVGSLGRINLRRGYYAYVGSAMGPGGLFSRIKRHLSSVKRVKWHIDYVLKKGLVVCVVYAECFIKKECELASLIAEEYSIVARKLGSTDCRCKSHFFFLGEDFESVKVFLNFLKKTEFRLGVSFSVVWC